VGYGRRASASTIRVIGPVAYLTASDAEASAQRRARTEGIRRVLVHDCYTRVHEVPASA
jgi:hypothetical protein